MKSLSCVQLFATPWTEAYQAPPSMGFSRQEYWSGLPLSFPFLHTLSSIYCYYGFFDDGHSDQCEVISHCGLICISLIMNDVEHLFVCLIAICIVCLLSRNVCLYLLPPF